MADNGSYIKIWGSKIPPVRPSFLELSDIESYLKGKIGIGSSALILGTTPEFLDLAYRSGYETDVADRSTKIFKSLSFSRYHPLDKLKLINCDWENMDRRIMKKYDVVFGDLILNVTATEYSRLKIVSNIRKIMKKKGLLVLRNFIFSKFPENFDSLLKKFDYKHTLFEYFSLPLLQIYRNENGYSITADIIHELKRMKRNKVIDKLIYVLNKEGWNTYLGPKWMPTKKELDNLFSNHFKVEKVLISNYLYSKYCPTYIMFAK